jgi:hypothetical protein
VTAAGLRRSSRKFLLPADTANPAAAPAPAVDFGSCRLRVLLPCAKLAKL